MSDPAPLTYTEALHQTPLPTRLNRAKHHYTKRLAQLHHDHTQLTQLHTQYTQLTTQLTTLPTQLTPPYPVPFGPLAHFAGHLRHTNEWLVLLGGAWWLECTAGRARRVAERRLAEVVRRMGRVGDEERRVRGWMEEGERVMEEAGGRRRGQGEDEGEGEEDEIVEIKEEYKEDDDEEEEEEIKGAGADMRVRDRADSGLVGGGMTDAEFDAYWDKLAELEEEEERQESTAHNLPRADTSRHTAHNRDAVVEEVEADEQPVALPVIRSPADIYKHMQLAAAAQHQQPPPQPKPATSKPTSKPAPSTHHEKRVSFSSAQPAIALIDPVSTRPLRHHTHSPPPPATSLLAHSVDAAGAAGGGVEAVSSNPALASAFSGAVLERDVGDDGGVGMLQAPVVKKKMSRFMAERLGLKVDND